MRGRRAKKLSIGPGRDELQQYRPPSWAWSLAQAFLSMDVEATVDIRCRHAGIHKSTFYRQLHKPEFVAWFKGILRDGVFTESADVRQSLVRLCLDGDLDAIRLWYELFGQFVPTTRSITDHDIRELSNEALDAIERILEEETCRKPS